MLFQLFLRGLVVLSVRMTIALTYIYSFKGHVNIGIIATIYQCSAITFTLLIFWWFYNQKLTGKDIVSFVFIFLSVGLIALGAEKRSAAEHKVQGETQVVEQNEVVVEEEVTDGDVKYYFFMAIA